MNDRKRLDAVVRGTVQGVFFRANARAQAEQRGIVGTVRNRPDGTVAVTAEGEDQDLRAFLAWLESGPERARVTRVDASWGEPSGRYNGFRIVE